MASQPPPDIIEPHAPPELPVPGPAEPLTPEVPELVPTLPDRDFPDQTPDEEPAPTW
ncbi:MAG: hypothetical protein V4475_02405 [Pseudomonadota bacterium]